MFVKHFSVDSRRRSLSASLVFSIIATLASLAAIGWGMYTYFVSMALLSIVGGPVAGAIPYVIASVGMVNLLVAARSIRVAVVARRQTLGAAHATKSVFNIAFNVAALLLPVFFIDVVCGVVLLCSAALAQLTSSSSLYAACFGYHGDAASRKDLDNVQRNLQCCGPLSPDNWATLNPRSVTPTPTTKTLPMSCCPLPHVVVDDCQYSSKMVPGTVAHSVVYSYHHGCIHEAVTFLYSQHFWSAGVAFAMAFTMLLVAVCQRLAHTSARAALESGDSTGPAPAWLFRDPRSSNPHPPTDKPTPSSSLWRDESSGWPRPRDPVEPGPSKPKSGYRRFANQDNEGSSESEEVTGSQRSGKPPLPPPPPQIRPIKHIRLPYSEGVSTKEDVYEVYSRSGPPAYYGPDGLPLNQDQVQVLKPPASSPVKRTQSATLSAEQRSSEDQESAKKSEQSEGGGSRKKNKFSLARVFRRVVRKSRSGGRRRLLDERSMSRHTSRSELPFKESKDRGSAEETNRLLRPSWTSQRNFQDEASLKASDEEYSPRRSRRTTPRGVQRMRISEAENEGVAGAAACVRQIRCLDGKANQRTNCQDFHFPSPSTYRTSSDMPTELSVTPVPSSDEEYAMGAIRPSPSPSKTSTCSEWSSRESSPERRQPLFRQAASQTTFDSTTTTTTDQLNLISATEATTMPFYGVLTQERRGVCLTIEQVPKVISLSFVITDERMPVEVPRRSLSHSRTSDFLGHSTSALQSTVLHSSSALQSTEGRTGTICLSQLTNSSERSVSVCALDEFSEPKRPRLEDGSTGKVDRGVPNDSSAEEGLLSDSVDGSWREDSATELSEAFDAPLPPVPPTTNTPDLPKKAFYETDVYPLLAPEDKSDDFGFFGPFKAADAAFPDDESSNGRQRTFSFDEEYRVDSCFVTRSHPGLTEQQVSFNDLSKVMSRSNFLEFSPSLGCALVLNGSRDDFEFCQTDMLEKTPSDKSDRLMNEIGSVNIFETVQGNPSVTSPAPPSLRHTPPLDNQLNFICGLKDDVSSWFALDAQREKQFEKRASSTVQDCIVESSKQFIAVPNHNSIQLLYEGSSKPRESSEILLRENNTGSIWGSTQSENKFPKTPCSADVENSIINEQNLTEKLAPHTDQNSFDVPKIELTEQTFAPVLTKDSRQECSRLPSKANQIRNPQFSRQKLLTALIKKQDTPLSSGDSIHEERSINRHSVAPAVASLGIVGLDQSTNVKTTTHSLTSVRQRSRSSVRDKSTSCSKHRSADGLFKRQNKVRSARSSTVPTNLKEVFCAASAPVCPEALSAVPLTVSHTCDTLLIESNSAEETCQSAEKERIGTSSNLVINIPSKLSTSKTVSLATNVGTADSRGSTHRSTILSKQNSISSAGTVDFSEENHEDIKRDKIPSEMATCTTLGEMPRSQKKTETSNLRGRVPSKLLETTPRPGYEISRGENLQMEEPVSIEESTDLAEYHSQPSLRSGVRQVNLTATPLITGTERRHASRDKTSVCFDIAETRSASDACAVPNRNPITNIPCLYLPDSSSTDTANSPLAQLEAADMGERLKIPEDHGGKGSDDTSSLPRGNDTSASESGDKLELDSLKLVPSSVTTGENHQGVPEDPPDEGSDLQVEPDLEKRSEHAHNPLKASNFVSQREQSSGNNIRSENTSEKQGNVINTASSEKGSYSLSRTFDKETSNLNRTELGNRLHLPISRFNQVVNLQDCWNSYAGDRPPPTEGEFSSEIERKLNSFGFDSAVSEILVTDQTTVVRSRHPIPRYNPAARDMDWPISSPGEDTGCDANKIELPLVPFLEFILNLDPETVDTGALRKILQEAHSQLHRGDEDMELQSPCRFENATTNDADTLDRRKGSSRSKVVSRVSSTYRLSQGTIMSEMGINLSQFKTNIFVRDPETNTSELSSNRSSSSYKCNNCDCSVNAQTTAEDSSFRNDSQETTRRKAQKETSEQQLGQTSSFQSNSSHFDSADSEWADFLRTSDFESAQSTSSTSTITERIRRRVEGESRSSYEECCYDADTEDVLNAA